jgi:hypothetical protein
MVQSNENTMDSATLSQSNTESLDLGKSEAGCLNATPSLLGLIFSFLSLGVQALVQGVKRSLAEPVPERVHMVQRDNKTIICNPVIARIISDASPELKKSLGGSVSFRSKLHSLRQEFDKEHKAIDNLTNLTDPILEVKDSVLCDLLSQHPVDIIVKYTDDQFVKISYDKQKKCCAYSIRKPKALY